MKAEPRPALKNVSVLALAILVPLAGVARGQATGSVLPGPKPADAPSERQAWIGDYRDGVKEHTIFERRQRLWLYEKGKGEWPNPDGARGITAGTPLILRFTTYRAEAPSKCPALTMKGRSVLIPTIRVALRSSAGTATCCAARWNPRALPFTKRSGGISMTKSGSNTRS